MPATIQDRSSKAESQNRKRPCQYIIPYFLKRLEFTTENSYVNNKVGIPIKYL